MRGALLLNSRSTRPSARWSGATSQNRIESGSLTELGIDPDSAGAIISAIFAHDWTFWLSGSPNAAFAANILEPRFGAPWAHVMGKTPAEALGTVFVICLDNPPWELDDEVIRRKLKEKQSE